METFLFEKFPDRTTARQREKYLKSGVGKAFIKKKRTDESSSD